MTVHPITDTTHCSAVHGDAPDCDPCDVLVCGRPPGHTGPHYDDIDRRWWEDVPGKNWPGPEPSDLVPPAVG